MPDSVSRLPARPSLEQLRKQAKDLLRDYRAGHPSAIERFRAAGMRTDPNDSSEMRLADAQFAVARQYGFDTWPKLVHHIEALAPAARLERFNQITHDLIAVVRSEDRDALGRLAEIFGHSANAEQVRARVYERLRQGAAAGGQDDQITMEEAQRFVAQMYSFESWPTFVASLSAPPSNPRSAPLGMSSTPPFYRIDWKDNTIEPRPPLSEGDWDTLFDLMEELRITGLNARGQMTDKALARLARLDHVTRLNLEHCDRLTDEGLCHLSKMPQLEELDLSGWNMQITDRGLEVLRHLPALERFKLCWPQRVTDSGVAHLRTCDRLATVNLLGTPTGDGAIAALAGKQTLHHLSTGALVTDAGLPLLHQFPFFKRWQGGEISYRLMGADAQPNQLVLGGSFTNQGFSRLRGLDGLFALNLFGDRSPQFTPAGLAPLGDLPNLGFLSCGDEFCTDEAMRQISTIPRLRMLLCQDTVAGDDGFTALSRSQTIEYIWGRHCHNLKGRGFKALARISTLKGLSVSCLNVDVQALSALPDLPALREYLPIDVPDAGFRHVGRCEQLEGLWCMYCQDTGDTATEHLKGLSRLQTYYAGKTRITDRSLEILGRLEALEKIELWNTSGVTDAGLVHLARLPRLRELNIDDLPHVTRDGAAIFPAHVRVTIR
jgi:hypothetical protein